MAEIRWVLSIWEIDEPFPGLEVCAGCGGYGWLSDNYNEPYSLVITDVGCGCTGPVPESVPICENCAF